MLPTVAGVGRGRTAIARVESVPIRMALCICKLSSSGLTSLALFDHHLPVNAFAEPSQRCLESYPCR